jgi:putative membrane protein
MTSIRIFLSGWEWNAAALIAAATFALGFAILFGRVARWCWILPALVLLLATLCSRLEALADGVLFSAHMAQHLLLLLIVPAMLWLGLPRTVAKSSSRRAPGAIAAVGWIAGIGSMWFWHVPEFCDAAASSASIHMLQTASLLGMGLLFWRPILSSSQNVRLSAGLGVAYLFTACLACTALGIILTLTPIEVCPIFRAPLAHGSPYAALREAVGASRDREIGGLLMWVPMCAIYVGAIIFELLRWFGDRTDAQPEKPPLSA